MLWLLLGTISADALFCYNCDAARENGVITRGSEACFKPGKPNNLTINNAGNNGTCIVKGLPGHHTYQILKRVKKPLLRRTVYNNHL